MQLSAVAKANPMSCSHLNPKTYTVLVFKKGEKNQMCLNLVNLKKRPLFWASFPFYFAVPYYEYPSYYSLWNNNLVSIRKNKGNK